MANWNEILNEINKEGGTHDIIRRKYLKKLSQHTNRNVIAYYSGWLQKPNAPNLSINDNDKNGLMNAIHGLDYSRGLDLVLHTPGGETAATESIVDYLRRIFGVNIRAIIPQLAMSAGTMIACSCKEIIMGKQSSLGPIDPQIMGIPAHGILEEFKQAAEEIKLDQSKMAVWQPIIAKYPPAFIGECQKSMQWSEKATKEWLESGMFEGDTNKTAKADKVVAELANHALTLSHARHLSIEKCEQIGLKIVQLEQDSRLQDAVLSVHHSFMLTFDSTPAVKIIENQKGNAYIQTLQTLVIQK